MALRYLVSGDADHYFYLEQYKKAYPDALVIGVDGLQEKAKDLKFDGGEFVRSRPCIGSRLRLRRNVWGREGRSKARMDADKCVFSVMLSVPQGPSRHQVRLRGRGALLARAYLRCLF